MSASGADPWSWNYFDPPTPHVPPPSPKAHVPKLVPGLADLFRVQRNALKVVDDLDELQRHLGHHEDRHLAAILHRLKQDSDNTYKTINTYLKHETEGAL